jgi:hypothetical protein
MKADRTIRRFQFAGIYHKNQKLYSQQIDKGTSLSSVPSGGDLIKDGDADGRSFRESNAYFTRQATTTQQKSESYQELQRYQLAVFNGLHYSQLSPCQSENDADLVILNNHSYLAKIRRIKNMAHILEFKTLFPLLWLDNTIRNLSYAFRIPILQIQIVPTRKMSRVRKIAKVNSTLITTI